VRRMFGGGRFSFSWESLDLRLRGLSAVGTDVVVVVSGVCESGMEMSSFAEGCSSCDCEIPREGSSGALRKSKSASS
jgi:hypothetical protein